MSALSALRGKTVVGFGASVAAVATLAGSALTPELFANGFWVDGNAALHGDTVAGATIRPPSAIASWLSSGDKEQLFVVVFAYGTRAVAAIFDQLAGLGLERGRHFTDCSTFAYDPMAAQMRQHAGITADADLFHETRKLALASPLDNRSSISGTWLMQQLLRHQLAQVDGDVAEAGVYKGGSAFMTLQLIHNQLTDQTYHLLDSFAGLPELSVRDPQSRSGEFADVSIADVRELFAQFSQVAMHVGLFADTFTDITNRRFCFAYVDCDLYEPAVECCDFFYPRLSPGGMMLFHDYWVDVPELPLPTATPQPFTGIRLAVDEMAKRHDLKVIRFAQTTHALIVKA